MFLSSRKYDPGCSSRMRILIFYPSQIPDPGGQKGTGSQIRNTVFYCGQISGISVEKRPWRIRASGSDAGDPELGLPDLPAPLPHRVGGGRPPYSLAARVHPPARATRSVCVQYPVTAKLFFLINLFCRTSLYIRCIYGTVKT